jgi:DNA-binding MarR family transcriptional regulator
MSSAKSTYRSSLQHEIAQNRPFDSRSQEAVLGLMKTSAELKNRFAEQVDLGGLTHQQYNVLRILRGAEPDGLPTLTIAERMIERTPGITGLVDRLEGKGLVERGRLAGDRRCVICRITAAGLELLADLDPMMKRYDEGVFEMLDTGELEQLVRILDKIRAGL